MNLGEGTWLVGYEPLSVIRDGSESGVSDRSYLGVGIAFSKDGLGEVMVSSYPSESVLLHCSECAVESKSFLSWIRATAWRSRL